MTHATATAKPPPDVAGFFAPGSDAERLFAALDLDRMPRHVAVIMDGNGRWAKARGLPRVAGHEAGVESVRDVVETAARLRLDVLTLYAFSVENWKRPRTEVTTLMGLLKLYLRKEMPTLMKNDIRFRAVGRTGELSDRVRAEIERAEERTAGNRGLLFQVALNYGGRAEIVDACRQLVERARAGAEFEVDEATIASCLYGSPIDPDLLIRTSGELRVSNFLLWQIAYAEIYVTDLQWPDFRRQHFLEALVEFQRRERRYGDVTAK